MTDLQLQLGLAKLLPEKLVIMPLSSDVESDNVVCWPREGGEHHHGIKRGREVLDTEWLYVCWLIEQGMTDEEHSRWRKELRRPIERSQPVDALYGAFKRHYYSASWQQRAAAILKVKGTV